MTSVISVPVLVKGIILGENMANEDVHLQNRMYIRSLNHEILRDSSFSSVLSTVSLMSWGHPYFSSMFEAHSCTLYSIVMHFVSRKWCFQIPFWCLWLLKCKDGSVLFADPNGFLSDPMHRLRGLNLKEDMQAWSISIYLSLHVVYMYLLILWKLDVLNLKYASDIPPSCLH